MMSFYDWTALQWIALTMPFIAVLSPGRQKTDAIVGHIVRSADLPTPTESPMEAFNKQRTAKELKVDQSTSTGPIIVSVAAEEQ